MSICGYGLSVRQVRVIATFFVSLIWRNIRRIWFLKCWIHSLLATVLVIKELSLCSTFVQPETLTCFPFSSCFFFYIFRLPLCHLQLQELTNHENGTVHPTHLHTYIHTLTELVWQLIWSLPVDLDRLVLLFCGLSASISHLRHSSFSLRLHSPIIRRWTVRQIKQILSED